MSIDVIINGIELQGEVIRPDVINKDYPTGYGLRLRHDNDTLDAYRLLANKDNLFKVLDGYGVLIVERSSFFSHPHHLTGQSVNLSWHRDDGRCPGPKGVALWQDQDLIPREYPTLAGSEIVIYQHLSEVLKQNLESIPGTSGELKRIKKHLKSWFKERSIGTLLYDLFQVVFYNNPLVLKLVLQATENMKPQIITFDWLKERGNLLLIENTARSNCLYRAKTLHAAFSEGKDVTRTHLYRLHLG